jgi:hypothetical protein
MIYLVDHQVASGRARIIRHDSALGRWEYAIGEPHPSLHPHVRDTTTAGSSRWPRRCAGASRRPRWCR